jgi:uncharacterized protein with ParB-like and HNH nuclease domain
MIKSRATSSPRVLSFIINGFEEGYFKTDSDYQRELVWKLEHKRDLIVSIFNGFPIGSISVIESNISTRIDYIEVVDGKQRINAIWEFFENKFSINIDGKDYFFNDLPIPTQRKLKNSCHIGVNVLNSDITEIEKFEYFYAINFKGVPQNNLHRTMIESKLSEKNIL